MAQELEDRKCVLTGRILNKDELLRFTLMNDGTVVPDFNKKIGGRGFYISNSKQLLDGLIAKNPLGKILHTKVVVDALLPQTVEHILYNKGLETLNLARKSGNLVLGFEKVKEKVLKNKADIVIIAHDSGHDGKDKIAEIKGDAQIFDLYSTADLSQALSKENTVYAAVLKSSIANMVQKAFTRYQTFLKSNGE